MSSQFVFDWRGRQVKDKMLNACAKGINAVMASCVAMAKVIHPPVVRTGTFQGSIQLRAAEVKAGGHVEGQWGSYDVNYALPLETKTFSRVGLLRPLRKSADVYYPDLPKRVKEYFGD